MQQQMRRFVDFAINGALYWIDTQTDVMEEIAGNM